MKTIGKTLVVLLFLSAPLFAQTWTARGTVVSTKAGSTTFTTDIYKDAAKIETWTGPTLNDPTLVAPTIMARLRAWYLADTYDVSKLGTITYVPPTPVQPPTDAEKARTKYSQDVLIYQGMLSAVKLGIKAANDKAITDQAALLVSTFLPEYYPILAALRF